MSLSLSSLTFGYGRRCLAMDLTVSLPPHRLTALLGANGTGKSSLLRIAAGLMKPQKGSVYWGEEELSTLSLSQRAQQLSVVLTERTDTAHLTVYEAVAMGRTPYTSFFGTLAAADKAVVEKSMEQTAVTHLAHRPLSSLSDGERQRVMIAKALAQETPMILLDEPTSFLDFRGKIDLLQLLHRLTKEERKTILFSTHDIELALRTVDYLWLLHDQRLTAGTPEDLLNNNALSAFFANDGLRLDPQSLRLESASH